MSFDPAQHRMVPEQRWFEDFRIGETLRHATPRTLTVGDASLYSALYGCRFAAPRVSTGRKLDCSVVRRSATSNC